MNIADAGSLHISVSPHSQVLARSSFRITKRMTARTTHDTQQIMDDGRDIDDASEQLRTCVPLNDTADDRCDRPTHQRVLDIQVLAGFGLRSTNRIRAKTTDDRHGTTDERDWKLKSGQGLVSLDTTLTLGLNGPIHQRAPCCLK
jgi:hypothetical protein